MPDVPGNASTTSFVAVGGWINGTLETVGDQDWFRIELVAGQEIVISLVGSGVDALEDPYMYLRDSTGNIITENDDSGSGRDSRIVFTAPTSGTYYIDVGAYPELYDGNDGTGTYTLSVAPYTPPPVFDYDQIGNQLTHGYWNGDYHRFDVAPGGTITVNLTALTAEGKLLARAALGLWSDVIGVTFSEVTTGGQITFDDNEDGAFASSNWSNHIISTSHVNISTQWLADYGASLNSYAFQTYIHEIGHALGLGHAGNYDGSATYPYDASYANDAWSTTIMSYFSQTENSYFADQGFTQNFALTPMNGDIVAMQALYGASSTTRTGNTTYGFNSTADRSIFNASQYPTAVYTIIDNGGTDTLDYSGFWTGNLINLNQETFSNVGGRVGNVVIARGTVIENAIGGMGSDTIIGNAANNVLNGGGGIDTVSYEAATSAVTVNLSIGTAQNTGGAGIDTLSNFERLIGSNFNDVLTGRGGGAVYGGGGNDVLRGSGGGDDLYGQTGNDIYYVDSLGDSVVEYSGEGVDTVRSSVSYTLGANVEQLRLLGSASINATGNSLANLLVGNSGNNILDGGTNGDTMKGRAGNDIYYVNSSRDEVVEYGGEGVDTVRSLVSYVLGDNVEQLRLLGTASIKATGNELANVLVGNSGNNILDGGTNGDTMKGGAGNDVYYVNSSRDKVVEYGGEGVDTARSLVSYVLGDNVEQLRLLGSASIKATGNELNNLLVGNSGNNVITGGGGRDRMKGEGGSDRFVFDDDDFGGSTMATADRIHDFSRGEGDLIDFSRVDANAALSGDQAFDFIGTGAFTGAAGQLRYEQISGNTYVSGDLDGDGVADFMVQLDGAHTLTAGDFIL